MVLPKRRPPWYYLKGGPPILNTILGADYASMVLILSNDLKVVRGCKSQNKFS